MYSALARLNQNPAAIAELKKVYKAAYKTDLLAALEDDFSGSELDHVKQLLADGETAMSRPAKALDMGKLAEKIHTAISGFGTDEEAVYSALATLNNNPVLIKQLKDKYKSLYKRDLSQDIAGDFSGSELVYVQNLLADGSASEKINVHNDEEAKKAKEIIKAIKEEYGIDINSQAGVDAIKKDYTNVPKSILDKLQTTAWEYRELVALKQALDYFAPILGNNRDESNRKGKDQEVLTIGKVDQAIDRDSPAGVLDTTTLGEYFSSSKNFSIFTAGLGGKGWADIGGPFKDNEELLVTSIIHEIAHGLLKYRLNDFVTQMDFWTDAYTKSGKAKSEAPMTPYGQKKASEDLSEAAKFFFVKKADLLKSCPERHKFMDDTVKNWKTK